MRCIVIAVAICISSLNLLAQTPITTGSIAGKLTDKEMGGEPLPFANVLIKNTGTGATTDMEGLFQVENIDQGTYMITYSH